MNHMRTSLLVAAVAGLALGGCSMFGNNSSGTSASSGSTAPGTSYGSATPAPSSSGSASTSTAPASGTTMSNQQEANAGDNGSSQQSSTMVKQLQRALTAQGERVSVDGVMGPKTEAALRDYQQKHGLQATGQLDDATRNSLNLHA